MSALLAAFLVSGTAILSVGTGIFGAYWLISAVLSLFDPARPRRFIALPVPHQSHAGGD